MTNRCVGSGTKPERKVFSRRFTWLLLILALCATLWSQGPSLIRRASQAHALSANGLDRLKNWELLSSRSATAAQDEADDSCSYPHYLQVYLETGQAQSGPCSPVALGELWHARAIWRDGRAEEACGIWRKLDAIGDPWAAANAAKTQGDWSQVAVALNCLDLWDRPAAGALLGTIYTGWIADLYQDLGNALREQGQMDDAIEAYDRAAYWSPGGEAGPAVPKAELLVAEKQPEAAMAVLDQAIAQLPEEEHAVRYTLLLKVGEIAQSAQQMERAVAAYQQARLERPEAPFPAQRLDALYTQLGKPELAEAVLQEDLNGPAGTNPGARAELLTALGQLYERTQAWDAAACAYQAAIEAAALAQLPDKQTTARNRLRQLQERLGRASVCDGIDLQPVLR